MSNYVMAVAIGLRILYLLLSYFFEYNSQKRKQKYQALQEVKDGLKEDDHGKIIAAFDSINKLHRTKEKSDSASLD